MNDIQFKDYSSALLNIDNIFSPISRTPLSGTFEYPQLFVSTSKTPLREVIKKDNVNLTVRLTVREGGPPWLDRKHL